MKKLIFSIIFILFSSSLFAQNLPTVNQIYQAVEHGNLPRASHMIQVVLQAHPNSAKAHYVNAEILAREGRLAQAREEFQIAKRIAPSLSFVSASSVNKLENMLYRENNRALPTQQQNHFPVMTLLILVLAVLFIFFIVRSYMKKRNAVQNPYAKNHPAAKSSNQGNYQNSGSSGFGSGIASGLASGLAAGAGFAAGEALFDHFTHDNNKEVSPNETSFEDNQDFIDEQPLDSDFGISDDSSWEDDSFGGDDSW